MRQQGPLVSLSALSLPGPVGSAVPSTVIASMVMTAIEKTGMPVKETT
jgi:hypothetical protein